MKRTQIQLDESTYQLVRTTAFERRVSMAAVIREAVEQHLGPTSAPRRLTLKDFQLFGIGGAKPSPLDPISERHDEALAEDFMQ